MTTSQSWMYPATIVSIHDGDTVTCDLDMGMHTHHIGPVRIAGIDAPELATIAGKAARDYAATLLPPGLKVVVTSQQLDKYGRVLGAIALPDGRDFGQMMLESRHARPYDGGARAPV